MPLPNQLPRLLTWVQPYVPYTCVYVWTSIGPLVVYFYEEPRVAF
jgi:hypothetical protein